MDAEDLASINTKLLQNTFYEATFALKKKRALSAGEMWKERMAFDNKLTRKEVTTIAEAEAEVEALRKRHTGKGVRAAKVAAKKQQRATADRLSAAKTRKMESKEARQRAARAAAKKAGKPLPVTIVVTRSSGVGAAFSAELAEPDQKRLRIKQRIIGHAANPAGAVRSFKKKLDEAGKKIGRASIDRRGY